MKPATHTVNELFERDVRYVVPLFQRPYVWDRDDQWEPLWEDICVLLDHQTTDAPSGPVPSHFLGAIVLEQDDVFVPGAIPVFTVIDGQQRLTTLQLLLAAAAAALRSIGCRRLPKSAIPGTAGISAPGDMVAAIALAMLVTMGSETVCHESMVSSTH